MKLLAIAFDPNKPEVTIPGAGGGYKIYDPTNFQFQRLKISDVFSSSLNAIILIAGFLMFFWMMWGVFQYIFAGGNKENLGRARKRIMWAVIGFFITILAYTISHFFSDLLGPASVPF